jgi:hypothetical protein
MSKEMIDQISQLIKSAREKKKKATDEDKKHKWTIIEQEFTKAKRDLESRKL